MRINQLARELEVKPGVILELLSELGVTEKKTHSSAIEEDLAQTIRERIASKDERTERAAEAESSQPQRIDMKSTEAPVSVPPTSAPATGEESAEAPAKTATAPPAGISRTTTDLKQTVLTEDAPPAASTRKDAQAGTPAQAAGADAGRGGAPAMPERAPAMPVGSVARPPEKAPAPSPARPATGAAEGARRSPLLPPPLAGKGPGKPVAPPLPSALRRPSTPITPPIAGGDQATAEHEGETARRGVQSVALPPPLRLKGKVESKTSLFRHEEEEAAPAPRVAQPRVAAPPASVQLPPELPKAPAPKATAPGAPAPVQPAEPRRPAAPAAPLAPAEAQGETQPAEEATVPPAATIVSTPPETAVEPEKVVTEEPSGPKPGEILRSIPGQAASPAATPPRVVVVGKSGLGLKPGEPIVGQEAAKKLNIPDIVSRPSPGPARPPVPNRPTPVARQVARPVVPPTPEMVEKLKQMRTGGPGAPVQRPGMPRPRPGEPIYGGPVRPGQPMDRNRMPGRPSAPGARGRGMHPTSAPLLPDVAPIPSTPGRKPGAGRRAADRGRRQEREEKEFMLRPSRRREPEAPPPITRDITISEGITVKELSEKLGVKASMLIKKLLERKIFATINQTLDAKLADEISRAFGASTSEVSYEEETVQDIELTEVEGDLEVRPPVVTIMGHVDHGKTSLLDAIRTTNVADREAGGITQHIGAYYVEKDSKKIVFVDTPGHEAFTRMRARGAKVTDIVVLVVAADDGIMPQTEEAINHARAAKVPIIVAVNKIDKPDAQPERVKQQLTERGLMPEDWGGDTVTVPVSAKEGQNIDLLLEMILLVSEMQELRGNPSRPALGTILEAQLDKGRGPVATVIVRNGTLRSGDYFICGPSFGRIRAMFDDRGNAVKEAGPSMPVEVIGLEAVPEVGDTLQVVTDTAKAKQIAIYRESKAREAQMAKSSKITLERFHTTLREGEMKELLIVLKADVGGTAEVIAETLEKLSNDKVRLRVILTGVGAISESDVLLASASNAIVIGFNVRPDRNAVSVAEQENVDIRLHTIIYELTDEVKQAMTGMLEPVFKEVFRGRAEVRDTFRITKVGTIAGCLVTEGAITRDSQVRLLRDNMVVHTGKISSLKRYKDDASEVKTNLECGIGIENFNDVKPGDVIEAFVRERVQVEAFA